MITRTVGALALAAASVATILAPFAGSAAAAPPANGDANATINRLESEGNRVIVSKVGDGTLEHCSVSSVARVDAAPNLRPTRGASPRRPTVYVRLDCRRASA
ncbi:hypothetical protein OS122_30175 [Mycolicibacterium mucogenicum]|uniref:hypothetical protein n=1 Tax=Mycolicibacterium mucogenicum TaxID=56689 RepID=UPI002269B44F|nr:hypothetical protein [Mycolicibacterium mucogenicum]MCX8565154.1 hypothetical protein [Mycolicibacterium mucogenicum]